MMSKKITLLVTLSLSLFFLTACMSDFESHFKPDETSSRASSKKQEKSEKEASSSKKSSKASSSKKEKKESQTETSSSKKMEELPANASEAPTDKIYATGDSVVYYKKYDGGLKVHTPDFEGYTTKIVKKILGKPEKTHVDSNYMLETFSEKEKENLVNLYQEGHLTEEQLHAFWAGVVDLAQTAQLEQTFTVFTYKEGQVQLVFKDAILLQIQKCFILTKKNPLSLQRRGFVSHETMDRGSLVFFHLLRLIGYHS